MEITNQGLRVYHFGNMYLSSIQQGIQSAHAQMELFLKYNPISEQPVDKIGQVFDWASKHKTMICLNAGYASSLFELKSLLESEENPFAWSYFVESEEALQGVLTNICVILPERIYGRRERVRKGETMLYNNIEYKPCDVLYMNGQPTSEVVYSFSNFEIELYNFVNSCSFAK